ncbi:MAG: hypothetical protein QW039_06950, partial [Fervidicoccaceae archaeon]
MGVPLLFWFKPEHLLYFWDESFPFNPWLDIRSLFYTWSITWNFGRTNSQIFLLPYYLSIGLLNIIFPLWLSQMILWYILFSLSGCFMFISTRYFIKEIDKYGLASLIAGLSYMYSTFWIVNGLQNPLTIVIFYVFFPLFILFFHNIIYPSQSYLSIFNRNHIFFVFIFFLSLPAFLSPEIGVLIIFMLLYFLYFLYSERNNIKKIIFGSLSVLILLILLLMIYLPFFYILLEFKAGFGSSISPGSSFVNTLHYWLTLNSHGLFYSFLNSPFVIGESYPKYFQWNWLSWYTSIPFFIIVSFKPIFGFSSAFFIKNFKLRIYKFTLIFAIVGIILVSGLNGPTSVLYYILIKYIPYFYIFDNPWMWFSIILDFSYSFLIAITFTNIIEHINNHISSKKLIMNKRNIYISYKSKKFKYIFTVIIIIMIMIPAIPLIDGSAVPHGTPSEYVEIPNYVNKIVNYFNSQSGFYRILSLPLFETLSQGNWSDGEYFATNPLYEYLNNSIIASLYDLSNSERVVMQKIMNLFFENNTKEAIYYLNSLNIQYILVNGDYSINPGNILEPYNQSLLLTNLNNSKEVLLVNKFGPDFIYKTLFFKPIIYPAILKFYNYTITKPFNSIPLNYSITEPFNSIPLNYSINPHILVHNLTLNLSAISWNGLNFGRNYSNIVIHNSTMLIYFNYTKNITWNWYQATTTGNMSLNTSFYDYLIVNYTLTPNTNLYFYADGENAKIISLPLLYTEELGSSTIGIFSLSNVYNKLYSLTLAYSVGTTNNSKGILKIYSIKFVSAQANIFNGLNFGRNYSNIVIHNSTMLIYFNYTKNITWNWYQATTTGNM